MSRSKRNLGLTVVKDGPDGHCDVCMSIRRARVKPVVGLDGDFCFVAPKSLLRPIQYKKFHRRHQNLPKAPCQPCHAITQVDGVLKKVGESSGCTPEIAYRDYMERLATQRGLEYAMSDRKCDHPSHGVFIEHRGLFTKAPPELLTPPDFMTREVYLETADTIPVQGPLDLAIMIQKAFTVFVKIIFGMMAGIALFDKVATWRLINYVDLNLYEFYNVYGYIDNIVEVLLSVMFITTLVGIFDWMDLAHMNPRHLRDTIEFRKIWIIAIAQFTAYVIFLTIFPQTDADVLHDAPDSNFKLAGDAKSDPEVRLSFTYWNLLNSLKDLLIIGAWIVLVSTRTDDLFLIHLSGMAKYGWRAEGETPKAVDLVAEQVCPAPFLDPVPDGSSKCLCP